MAVNGNIGYVIAIREGITANGWHTAANINKGEVWAAAERTILDVFYAVAKTYEKKVA